MSNEQGMHSHPNAIAKQSQEIFHLLLKAPLFNDLLNQAGMRVNIFSSLILRYLMLAVLRIRTRV